MYAEKFIAVPRRSIDAEVLGERGEVPRDAGAEGLDVHVLDVLERAGDDVVVLGPGRRDREAAVAGDDGGDAVEARRRERRVPEHLRVVVRVDVDEPGSDDVPAGVEHALAVEVGADRGDLAVADGDVGTRAGRAGAVDDGAALDDEIDAHGVSCRNVPAVISRTSVWTAAGQQVQRVRNRRG